MRDLISDWKHAAFYDLLRHPLGRWMLSDLDMQDFAIGMA